MMNPATYRDLERILSRTLNAFSATRQKLDPYERRMRDRLALMLLDVARARNRHEREKNLVVRTR